MGSDGFQFNYSVQTVTAVNDKLAMKLEVEGIIMTKKYLGFWEPCTSWICMDKEKWENKEYV